MKLMQDNPELGNFFKQVIKEGIKEGIQEQNKLSNRGKAYGQRTGTTNQSLERGTTCQTNVNTNRVKSPSDTTLYTPALIKGKCGENELLDKITNFVEGIRLEGRSARPTPVPSLANPARSSHARTHSEFLANKRDGPTREEPEPSTSRRELTPRRDESAKDKAGKFIIESEQFHASIEPPPRGEYDQFDDDDYFHLTCHVDSALKNKIEKGEFVDLEKLLPKQKNFKQEGRMEWVSKEGMTYLSPVVDRDSKITGIRKWEQAFRVYAAIYCNANPARSGEIWQYIYVINSAASSFHWDNVAYYDYTFRQMMSDRPQRKWSKTYLQLYQLAMRDPINKSSNSYHTHHGQKGDAGPPINRCSKEILER